MAKTVPLEVRVIYNAAAICEALNDIINKIDTWRGEGSMEHWQYSQLFDIVDAALAAPARNCDVVRDENEALYMCRANVPVERDAAYNRGMQDAIDWLLGERKEPNHE